jgi:hypothetical protein
VAGPTEDPFGATLDSVVRHEASENRMVDFVKSACGACATYRERYATQKNGIGPVRAGLTMSVLHEDCISLLVCLI